LAVPAARDGIDEDPEEIGLAGWVWRLLALASPPAFAATHLAAAPLNLAVLRLAQEMVGADTSQLSGIFLGGLIHPVGPGLDLAAADRITFDFESALREELLACGPAVGHAAGTAGGRRPARAEDPRRRRPPPGRRRPPAPFPPGRSPRTTGAASRPGSWPCPRSPGRIWRRQGCRGHWSTPPGVDGPPAAPRLPNYYSM
jgi:hypothetical protein